MLLKVVFFLNILVLMILQDCNQVFGTKTTINEKDVQFNETAMDGLIVTTYRAEGITAHCGAR